MLPQPQPLVEHEAEDRRVVLVQRGLQREIVGRLEAAVAVHHGMMMIRHAVHRREIGEGIAERQLEDGCEPVRARRRPEIGDERQRR